MRLLEPLSQNDSQWSQEHLGLSSNVTLGQAGCYVTSFAILSYYYGHPLSPSEMNQRLISLNLFTNQDLISSDDDLSKVFNDIKFVQTNHYESIPADLNLLKDLIADPTKCIIVEIDLGNDQVHFTPVVECDGTTVTIMNVWDGKIESLNSTYGDPAKKILKFVVYQGTPTADTAPDTIIEIKQGDFVKLIQKSSELDKIGLGLNFTQQEIDTLGFSEKVLEAFTKAQTSTPTPPVVDSAATDNSQSQQSISTNQLGLIKQFLALIGIKLQS